MRKGQGLSVNMLIVIAIGLVVLIVSILIFTKHSRNADEKLSDTCTPVGGQCLGSCGSNEPLLYGSCPNNQQCCPKSNAQNPVVDPSANTPEELGMG